MSFYILEYPNENEYEQSTDRICVNFEVTHKAMYKSEAEARTFCNLNKKCLGILVWDDSNVGEAKSEKLFSHCLFPNRLILNDGKWDRYKGTHIRKEVPGKC